MTSKKQLRSRFLTQRQAMSAAIWRQKSDAICQHLQDSEQISSARTILAYASFRQEPDLMPLLRSLTFSTRTASFVTIGLPRCQGKTLIWHQWHPTESQALQPGAYGILEPVDYLPTINLTSLRPQDVILVPAVGCDRHGYRLGYGGGFYDRLLSAAPWNTMTTIGIIFDVAHVDALPIEPWDQPLSAVCSESGIFLAQ